MPPPEELLLDDLPEEELLDEDDLPEDELLDELGLVCPLELLLVAPLLPPLEGSPLQAVSAPVIIMNRHRCLAIVVIDIISSSQSHILMCPHGKLPAH